jgi:hypothetical protein
LTEAAREAAASGEVIYLTDHGQRLAAIVPAHLAELLERGSDLTQDPGSGTEGDPSVSTAVGATQAVASMPSGAFELICTMGIPRDLDRSTVAATRRTFSKRSVFARSSKRLFFYPSQEGQVRLRQPMFFGSLENLADVSS